MSPQRWVIRYCQGLYGCLDLRLNDLATHNRLLAVASYPKPLPVNP